MTTFTLHQDVAVVEHGRVRQGYIADISGGIMEVRCGEDRGYFDLDTGWPALERCRTMRLFPVCRRTECENPVLDPCTDPGDPLGRQWCSLDCMGTDAEAADEMRTRGAW